MGESDFFVSDFSSEVGCADFIAASDLRGSKLFRGDGGRVVADASSSDETWVDLLRFPKGGLPSGKIWTVEIEYEILSLGKSGEVYFTLEGISQKGRVVAASEAVERVSAGKFSISAFLGSELAKRQFRILSRGPAKVALKAFNMVSRDIPRGSEWLFSSQTFLGMKVPPSDLGFLKDSDSFVKMGEDGFFPFIDAYGQFKHRRWKDKILSDGDFAARLEAETDFSRKLPDIPNRDSYGGLLDPERKYRATGRFRLEKVDGKWFFVTPDGNLFWSFGVSAVGKTAPTPIDGREKYFEAVGDAKYIVEMSSGHFYGKSPFKAFDFHRRNFELKRGAPFSPEKYGEISSERMRKWGLNTYGAWTLPEIMARGDIPYAPLLLSSWKSVLKPKGYLYAFWHPFPDWFDERFESGTKARLKRWHVKQLNSPMCIGAFMDNELPWQSRTLVLPRAVLTCPPDQPMKIALRDFLRKKYSDIGALNSAWGSDYADWGALLSRDDFVPGTESGDADLLAFEEKIYERYFSVCRDAIKEVSPDVLYFGCRMAWSNPLLAKVASKYCDAVAYNLYRNNVAGFSLPENCRDVPIIVGEYHIGLTENGVFGGGLRFRKTARERDKAFGEYATSAFENPNIVGIHWFQWVDQPASGRQDGENYACGFVDICDTPHWDLAKAARRLSRGMYSVRLGGKSTVKSSSDKTTTY